MRNFIIISFLIFSSNLVYAQQADARFIEVTGLSQKEVTPDDVEVTVTLRERENVKKENDLTERERVIMDVIRQFSIPEEDIVIDKIAGSSSGYYTASNVYHISKVYKVHVRKIDILDNLIVRLFEAGANDAQITKLSNKNIEKFKSDAAQEAVENGKLRAESIAKSLGITLGNAILVRELGPAYYPETYDSEDNFNKVFEYRATGAVHRAASVSTENVNVKKIVLTYRVVVRFEIKS